MILRKANACRNASQAYYFFQETCCNKRLFFKINQRTPILRNNITEYLNTKLLNFSFKIMNFDNAPTILKEQLQTYL
ncbi:hypothetical protein BpHYR1_020415 [Brachionus plicatilis]|uniref:Uncharacterized protein n=1 Tax=Brachionus plicatilis TaxID=10195 RepID=A0A3M7QT61_BRAPC|nr:hypothetical protein BpHYR1_020415 [Brachionus plicatilis]